MNSTWNLVFSRILKGQGTASLVFGNCYVSDGVPDRTVQVLLNDALIASDNLLGTVSVVNIKIDYGNAL